MAKHHPKKPLWYADYDRLFVKPQRRPKKRLNSRHALAIVVVFALMPLGYRYWSPITRIVNRFQQQLTAQPENSTEPAYHNHFPLKAAGIKRTTPIDQSRNLVATLAVHTVTFSNGYQLTIASRLDLDEYSRAHVVTPSKEADSMDIAVVDVDGRFNKDYVQADLRLYANVIGDFNAYAEAGHPNLVKLFKTEPIGTVQTGYVFEIPEKSTDKDYARLTRYFVFADGTGVVLKSLPEMNQRMRQLTSKSSFDTFQAACGSDFRSLAQDYTFKVPTSQ